jgi:hypothetical protein
MSIPLQKDVLPISNDYFSLEFWTLCKLYVAARFNIYIFLWVLRVNSHHGYNALLGSSMFIGSWKHQHSTLICCRRLGSLHLDSSLQFQLSLQRTRNLFVCWIWFFIPASIDVLGNQFQSALQLEFLALLQGTLAWRSLCGWFQVNGFHCSFEGTTAVCHSWAPLWGHCFQIIVSLPKMNNLYSPSTNLCWFSFLWPSFLHWSPWPWNEVLNSYLPGDVAKHSPKVTSY